MKKFRTLLSCAAVFVMVALNFGCADPNKKPVDSTPTVVPAPSEGTTQDKVPETPADVKKTVETEEDFKKAMEEIYQEIMAFFPSDPSVPSEEPEPSQYRSMRTAAPSEAELFEGDKAIEPLSEFIATFFKAVLKADTDSSFQLKDSINVKNLSFDQIIKAIDKFFTKEENKNMVEEIFSPYNSVDELLVDLADSLEVEDVEALKAKLNECITLTKLKYSGTLSIDQIEFREAKVNETPDYVEYELTSETMGSFNISDQNEEFGLKVEKLDSLLQFLTGNTAAFPIKNVTVEEALKISDAFFMTPLGRGPGSSIRSNDINDINDIEKEKEEWLAGGTSPEQCPNPKDFRINGTASSKIAFDFETASYTGTIEVSLNLESTTELFQNIMDAFENDSEAEAVELLNEIGGITISVKDSTFSSSSKLGDLIVGINESISKK